MSDEIPPARQCTMPTCENEALDHGASGSLCAEHHDQVAADEVADGTDEQGSTTPDGDDHQETEEEREDNEGGPSDRWLPERIPGINTGVWSTLTEEMTSLMNAPDGAKHAFGPEGIPENPAAPCTSADCAEDATTTADPGCECDARYKWTIPDNWMDFDTAREWAEDLGAGELSDSIMVVLQREGEAYQEPADPGMLIDGDDVVDDNGTFHPEFLDVIHDLADEPGYVSVSSSGHGAHAPLIGKLPDGVKQVKIPLSMDVEGFDYSHVDEDEGDGLHIDIFDGKHLRKATGKHVEGTPRDPAHIEAEALEEYCEEYGASLTTTVIDTDEHGNRVEREVTVEAEAEYTGPDPEEWDIPADRCLEYHATVEAHYHGHSTGNFWRVTGAAAAWGHKLGKTAAEVLADLRGKDRPGTSVGYGGKTEGRVQYDWHRAESEAFEPPSRRTLAKMGVLPEEYAFDEEDDEEWTVDPTTLDVVLDHERAWRAAKQTTPDDLQDGSMETIDLDVTDDGDAWRCPHCDGPVGVVQAVALDRETIDCCEEPLRDDDYDAAYWHARTAYGAPLPEFVSTETATDNWALVQGAVSQLSHWHLSGMDSTVTGDGGADDDVIAEIDPCWADSASGQRIVAFRSGQFYCREHECGVDPLRFVALEHGIISDCDDSLEGDAFTTAYHIAREQYGAPLPEWETGAPDHTPVLPPADDLLGELGTDTDTLDEAREAVTALFRSCARDRTASVLTTLPALGKTTAGVILADEYPLLYLGPRRELMAEVEQKADEWDRSCQHLPIFAAEPPTEGAIAEALDLVREEDKQLLRAREDLAERIDTPITDEEDDEDNEEDREIRDPETAYPTAESAHADGYESLSAARRQVEAQNRQIDRAREQRRAAEDDDIDLDRASCPCGNGTHGEAWQLVVHVARALGHTPQEIHTRDEELFGDTLPCHADGECEYALGWERATDPDDPNDILIGHYGHGYVDGARVHRERDADDHVSVTNRTIAIDEFPGDTYDQTFDEEFVDHAAWAAGALCPAVDDRQALFEQDLGDDDTLRAWIDGTATDDVAAFETVDARLDCMTDLREALEAAEHRREALEATDYEGAEAEGAQALIGALDTVLALGPDWDGAALDTAYTTLLETVTDVGDEHLGLLRDCSDIEEDILPVLSQAAASVEPDDRLGATTAPERCGDDLTDLVATAVTAFCEEREGAQGLIHAARMALAGGEEGCRELAIHADDGYAHPMAYLLLDGLIDDTEATDGAPTAPDAEAIIATEDFDFDDDGDGESGTNLARTCHGRQTILTDRNHHGALIRDPPAFQGGSESVPNPVIGLDATGRESLWEVAIGCSVETADIHETAREKRAFLRDVLNLQVVQTSPHIQSYSGSPDSTNFDGPVALVNRIAEEYSESLLRRDTLSATTKPGVITTKKAEGAIADRVRSDVGALEHYGDITGSNALGDHNLGAVLGSRHYGDAPVEKWAALAGESVEREGKGARLDYGCSIGNAFLKHMREDETLQAILRFGRDEEGAVVFAHTSALADSLPVVGEGQVVKTFTENGRDITNVARQYRDEEFAISDLVDEVECSRETIRRTLNEFAELGYLTKHETKNGVANGFQSLEEPGAGEVELPEIEDPFDPDGPPGGGDEDPHRSPVTRYYTWSVEVDMDDLPSSPRRESTRATLPAPARIAAGPPSE